MPEKYDPLKLEKEMQEFWDKESTYERVKNKGKGKKPFYFLDGPPYTSGKVHLGTGWNKSLKDMVLRYKRMSGHDVWDRAGYDMHGLPIENATMKKLGLQSTEDIHKFGIDKFIAECKQLCLDNMKAMNDDFKQMGVWMDFENAYQSITNEFIDGEWWLIKKAFENGRLYRGKRTMTWCTVSKSALAKHELEYKEVKDKSIFVKFKVKGTENEYLIIWTTTPWTIPLNLAIMVNPELDYVKAKVGDEVWIMSKALGPMIVQSVVGEKYEELESFQGINLKGMQYEHFFSKYIDYTNIDAKNPENVHTVVMSKEYVDTSAGSGLVHCAPGCGPQDYEVGHANGLPAFNTVDEGGIMHTNASEEDNPLVGLKAKKDDKQFVKLIEGAGHLAAATMIDHEYPHDWRYKEPVIFRATEQWFFKVEDMKDKLIEENNNIKWNPEAAYNAFSGWLKNLRDNSISKQRFWGTPIPIWVNTEDKDDFIVIGSIKELEELSGTTVTDPHKPVIDDVTISKDGKTYKRIPDVLDVWVDAGSASWNCLHFPYQEDLFDRFFPADFILEGKDQIRGWFNLLHVASMISHKKPSFTHVYMHGFVQDSQGRKMSKSLGNSIYPSEVVDEFGADTFRFYTIGGANPGNDLSYNPDDVSLKRRNISVLWNVVNYTLDYCKTNNFSFFDNVNEKFKDPQAFSFEEKYMLSLLHSTIKQTTEAFDEYKLNTVPLHIEHAFLELSRGYIQLIRDKSNSGTQEEKEAVAYTLYTCSLTLVKMFAIVAPYVSEKLYSMLKQLGNVGHSFDVEDHHSVHDCDWPLHSEKFINYDIQNQVQAMQNLTQGILAAREKANLGVRWPIKEVMVKVKKEETEKALTPVLELVRNQTNVKLISVAEEISGVEVDLSLNRGALGKEFGKDAPLIMKAVDNLSSIDLVEALEQGKPVAVDLDDRQVSLTVDHFHMKRIVPDHLIEIDAKDALVYLDSTRTPELDAEGYARELMRRVQQVRKDAGLVKTDVVEVFLQVPEDLVESLAPHVEAIKEKTGASGIMISPSAPEKVYESTLSDKIKGKEVVVFVQKQ